MTKLEQATWEICDEAQRLRMEAATLEKRALAMRHQANRLDAIADECGRPRPDPELRATDALAPLYCRRSA